MGKLEAIERTHVLQALSEFDELGREAFLQKYGRGPSRSYFLRHDGKRYDSKAVAAAAYGFARPGESPLSDFSGGLRTVKRALGDNLGFEFMIGSETSSPGLVIPAAWGAALKRVAKAKKNDFYMPGALLVALDMVEGSEVETGGGVRFEHFKRRFEELLAQANPEGPQNARAPFFHLSQSANVWGLSRSDLESVDSDSHVNGACEARFEHELASPLANEEVRGAIYQGIYAFCPPPLAASHRYLRSKRNEDSETDLWGLCAELLEVYPEEKDAQSSFKGTRSNDLSKQIQEEIKVLASTLIASHFWVEKCSLGAGKWSEVPWFAVFDSRESTTAQRGVYLVGHFGFDEEGTGKFRLGFGVAATEFKGGAPAKAQEVLTQLDSWSRTQLQTRGLLAHPGAPIGTYGRLGRGYDAGMIAALVLDPHELEGRAPELTDTLRLLLASYQTWVESKQGAKLPGAGQDSDSKSEVDAPVQTISSLTDAVDALSRAAERRSLSYDTELLHAFLLSLKTKPFCLLAGATGTGKSRLARLLTDVGARVRVEPVEPSWTDGTSVIGYRDLEQVFRPGVLTAHARKAQEEPDRIHVLVLDELNLARVEHYLAQWLSVIESRELVEETAVRADPLFKDEETTVPLPPNLVVVGTVNMDESTFAFSQRVLDRANTLALPSPSTLLPPEEEKTTQEGSESESVLSPSILAPRAITWGDLKSAASSEHFSVIQRLTEAYLEPTQRLLIQHGVRARISFRLRDEMGTYLLHGLEAGSLTPERLVDQQLRQRLLPKVCDGYSMLRREFVESVCQVWAGLGDSSGTTSSAAELLRLVFERQTEEDMAVSLWTALA